MKNLALALTAAVALNSCTTMGNGSAANSTQQDLTGTTWAVTDFVKGVTPDITFTQDGASGNAGCNRFNAQVTANKATGTLSISNIATTRMACENMEAESNYVKMLGKVNRYRVKGKTLELLQNDLLLLKFVKTN